MDDTQSPNVVPRASLLPRLVLWILLASLLVVILWPSSPAEFQWRLHLAGDRTNLYAAMAGRPVDKNSDAGPVLRYSRRDAHGQWSDVSEGRGDVLHVVAWQEDLAAFFADGGMYLFGPSDRGYIPPPGGGTGGPRMLWWLAAAAWQPAGAEAPKLVVLGLGAEGEPLYSERGADAWGDVQPVDLKADWSRDVADEMSAAMRGDELHVVWPARPVAETPTGQGPRTRRLMFARREADGAWRGPFEEKAILLDGPPHIAPYGDKLAMVYRASGESDKQAAHLAYAEYTPGDAHWHRVREITLPPREGKPAAMTDYGFTAGLGMHVLAVRYDDGRVDVFSMNPETGAIEALSSPPALLRPVGMRQPTDTFSPGLMLALFLVMALVFVLLQMARRRVLRKQLAEGRLSSQDVARMVSIQVERLMYLPTLVRRIAAVIIDLFLVFSLAALIVGRWMPELVDWQMVDPATGRPTEHFYYVGGIVMAVLVAYYVVMELIWQRTLGKMVCGVRVVDLGGRRPAWWRIIVRNLLRPIDLTMFGMVGLLSILWSRRNQTLGDRLAGTRVVKPGRTSGGSQDSDTRIA